MEQDELSTYVSEVQHRRKGEPLGPSSAGTCYRQLAYRYHGTPQSEPERNSDAADVGTLLHLGWSAMIGSLYEPGHRDADVVISIPGLPRPGTADDVDWDTLTVTDLKGAGGRAWQGMVDRGDVYGSYWKQLMLYAYGLSLMVEGDWTMRIVLLNRDTGERAMFEKRADRRAGKLLASLLEERHNRLYQSVMDEGSPEAFPREGRGPETGWPCDWCPWLSRCWPDAEGELSPQSSTVVDDPAEIAAWAEKYLEAQQAESKFKQAKQEAGAFLRGITGVFGQFKVAWPGGSPRADSVDCEAAADLLRKNDLPVPMQSNGFTTKYTRVYRLKRQP
jgi:hypothetical protein